MAPNPAAPTIIHLEGTTLEGGGQLLRLALGLSSLTKKPISITNIRGRRFGGGGLRAQHLTCVQWLGQACDARLSGVGLKSKEITFAPDAMKGANNELETGHVRINQSTPGSVNLVLQAILPYLLFSGAQSPIHVRIAGGTNVSNSPSYDYIAQVLVPMLELIGIPQIEAQIHLRSWSQGTSEIGSVTYTITPLKSKLPAFQLLERGEVKSVTATIIAPKDTEQSFREELDVMFERRESRIFGTTSNNEPEIEVTFEDSHNDKRYYLLLVATTTTDIKLGRDWLYNQGVRPGKLEKIVPTVVRKVSDDLLTEIEHGGCVDEHLRDQLVVFQALAEGKSTVFGGKKGDVFVEPSLHAQTAQWVAHEILDVDFDEQGGCEGVGLCPCGEQKGQARARIGETTPK
ncbi:RNA 3'-terminal phosphate cyclase [Clathrospora elynae]|uniref:RNA 3'-terminal phosphate cyclase n=1 Tax=Clathrospora elynae TaxID=706981 RepID=A0A6A5T0E9_9PLEO|nr:RNA 3'-terminal phosphate cyclase [Clathrospora elynae]